MLTGAIGLVLWQQPALHTVTLALGALGWLAGNAVWLANADLGAAVPFWMAFLVRLAVPIADDGEDARKPGFQHGERTMTPA